MSFGRIPVGRVDRSTTTLALAIGDVLVVSSFITYGTTRHGTDPLAEPAYVLATIAPFLIGWAIVAPPIGAYSRVARSSVGTAAAMAAGTWIVADAVGLAIRASPLFHGGAAPAFVLVTLVSGAVLLVAWRTAFVVLAGRSGSV